MNTLHHKFILLIPALLIGLAACSQEPQEIHYGSDECAHCQMLIMDAEFAGELISKTGKAFKFDAIECMAAFLQNKDESAQEYTVWVHSFSTGSWLDANEAVFVQSEVVKTPMGAGLIAFENEDEARAHLETYPGTIISLEQLLRLQMQTPDNPHPID